MKRIIIVAIFVGMFGWAIYDFTSEEQNTSDVLEQNSNGQGESGANIEEGLEVGQKAPDFEVKTLQGEKASLSNYKGERIMLNFWATWCPPCRAEMPDMEKFYQNKDVTILAVNLTGTEAKVDDVHAFKKEYGLSFPVLLDQGNEVATMYQIRPIPTTYMIDSEGIIQHKSLGAMNYERMVQQFENMK
ncbi:redoxin domain-containing protein [Pontibacillus sp. HN14]|uniref:Redoxin domain-containing protein n=1 Tax=Pontibacillus chungwhensis TaxID=265426 RepID=A0ABY8V2E9_9BACI|nr:redoxin domain-containing protein [Pontibacillus chungwhensis]MCD5325982.1 redoxin domain-containing protein [Pontibacillus sp. HN14]WIG00111.1 redoxin domain-containing protein [Pontibacillus chungwhensis]